jgi:cytoskeletal protein RodZ
LAVGIIVQSGSCAPRRVPRGFALLLPMAAMMAVLLAGGCSSELAFPAVHDMPPPRDDATLTPDQVKNATDALVSEREHLSTEAQATQAEGAEAAQPTGTVPAKPAVTKTKAKAKKKKPAPKPTTARASAQPAAAAATQTAGVDAKPQ